MGGGGGGMPGPKAGGPTMPGRGGGGGGGGVGPTGIDDNICPGDNGAWPPGVQGVNGPPANDCLRPVALALMSPRQWGHVNFCTLFARNSRIESSRFSSKVARCTSVSAVSQITSLIASFESMRSKCCNMLRNGMPCGVSATCVVDEGRDRDTRLMVMRYYLK